MSSIDTVYCITIRGYRDPILNIYFCERCYQGVQSSSLRSQLPLLSSHFFSLGPHHTELHCINCHRALITLRPLHECPICIRNIIELLIIQPLCNNVS